MIPEPERKKAQTKDQKLRILMDLLSHDINNHIYGSMGYLELLQTMIPEDPILNKYLSNSMSEMRSISHLVDNLRFLVNLSREPFKGEPVDIYQTIMQSVESAKYQIDLKEIDIVLSFTENECIVKGDRFLQDLFKQLLMNSMKYSRGNKASVKIDFNRSDGIVTLIYEDDGKGISDNIKDMVFRRFDRLVRDGDIHGKGMGLSVVNSVAERYGGSISLEDVISDGKVTGTRFWITLMEWAEKGGSLVGTYHRGESPQESDCQIQT